MEEKVNSETNAYAFEWKIENALNWCWLKEEEGIQSPVFIADGFEKTKWTLWFHPSSGEDEDFVGLYLQRAKDCDGPDFVEVFYQFALLAEDGTILKEKTASKTMFTSFFYWGFTKFELRERIFFRDRQYFLPEDTLTVQCSIWTTDQKPVHFNNISATSLIKVTRRCVVWEIDKPQNLESDVRNDFGDYSMACNLVLNKYLETLRVGLTFLDDNLRYISCNVSILDAKGRKECCGILKYFANDFDEDDGIFKIGLLSKEMIHNKERYFPNDVLSLDFQFVLLTVKHLNNSLENVIVRNGKFSKPQSDIAADLYSLFSDSILTDIEIRTPNQKFLAHKNILSARSPVFLTMFNQDMQEKKTGIVHITDYDDDTVERMLKYIYSGSVSFLNLEDAWNLYKIAHKYQILSLVNYCSLLLEKHLHPTNACDILVLAHFYTDNDLKNDVQNYILKQPKHFFYSQEWEDFMKDNIKLAADVMFMKITRIRRNLLSDA